MRELAGKLAGLDPGAHESLRVIEYFDTLLAGRVGLEAFLRGAALLSGVPAGLRVPARKTSLRVGVDGRRDDTRNSGPDGWPTREIGAETCVWIERAGAAHANDRMVLERLAMGVQVTLDRAAIPYLDAGAHLEQLIDSTVPVEERLRAAGRLHLAPHRRVRVIAAPPEDAVASRSAIATVVSTPVGPVFAVVDGEPTDPFQGDLQLPAMAGVGGYVALADVAAAWTESLTALRLTTRRRPVLRVTDLGALTVLAAGIGPATKAPPDVLTIERLVAANPAVLDTLEELAAVDSVRAAAAALGVHHSTVQHRIAALRDSLGFDPTDVAGRHRLMLALVAYRLLHRRFGSD